MRVTLNVVDGPHKGRSFSFDRHDTFLVGRSLKAQFSLPKHDRYFSRIHFLVEINPPLVCVMDLGSRNGTHVNGTRVTSAELRHGDRISAGHSVLQVSIEPAATAVPLQARATGTAEEVCRVFEAECQSGRSPLIADFLPPVGDPDRPVLLRELVLLEMEFRLGAGDTVRLEDYLKQFAELKTNPEALLDLIAAECTFRRRREHGLDCREYVRRFPALREQIQARLGPAPDRVATRPSPGHGGLAGSGPPSIPGFRLGDELGRGGMGVVYRGVRKADGALMAVKIVIPAVAAGGVAVERFLREADILRQLQHRHIVAYRGMGDANGLLWFAMDLVSGSNAHKLVRQNGPLEVRRALRLMLPVLGALNYAHAARFVHRDIKPSNVLVEQTKTGEEARLADFGLARTYQASQLSGITLAGAAGGTPLYMPPEQVLNFRDVNPAADQYSAAATLYFLVTRHAPYDEAVNTQTQLLRLLQEKPIPLLKRRPDLPRGLQTVLHKALASDPEERYQGVGAFAKALAPFAQ